MTDTQRERYEQRRQATTGFERRVLDLHAPNRIDWKFGGFSLRCGACGSYEDWPCSTAELALEETS